MQISDESFEDRRKLKAIFFVWQGRMILVKFIRIKKSYKNTYLLFL